MKKRWIFCGIFLILFLIILVSVLMGRNLFIDSALISLMEKLRNDGLTSVIKIVTFLGDKYFMLVLVLLISGFLYMNKHKFYSLIMCVNLFNIVVLNKGIKYIVRRERPANMLIEKDGFSFPSGHSMLSIGIYGLLMYLIYKSKLSKKVKTISMVGLSILIVVIGFTRMYLGVHYPSDVIAGYLLTAAYLIVFISIIMPKIKEFLAKK